MIMKRMMLLLAFYGLLATAMADWILQLSITSTDGTVQIQILRYNQEVFLVKSNVKKTYILKFLHCGLVICHKEKTWVLAGLE